MLDTLLSNDPVAAAFAFFIVLIPLILVHELGHFLAGRAAGITILEFGIGFPPRITRLFTWRETEFTLNWIPLGGFVRPLGEDMIRPVDEATVQKDRESLLQRQESANSAQMGETSGALPKAITNPKSVIEASPLWRIAFMAAGAIANFLLAFVLFAIVALNGLPQIVGGSVGIVSVQENSVFQQGGIQAGDIITDLNGEKFDNTADFITRFYAATEPITLTVNRTEAEPFDVTLAHPDSVASSQVLVRILGISDGSPASQAGLQQGDLVTAFDGKPMEGIDPFRERTRGNLGTEITLTVLRGQETLDVKLTPRANPPEGQGAIGIIIGAVTRDTTLGLIYQDAGDQQVIVAQSLPQAISYGWNSVVSVITRTIQIPAELVSGMLTAEQARPVSVVGMSQIGAMILRQSVEQGRAAPILEFVATISVALGFFNLLPIPALDGGRILFVLIEMVRGRPISQEREGLVHLVGLVLLLSLSVLVILNDVVNPITNSFR
jgi:regulator of sigma E protease